VPIFRICNTRIILTFRKINDELNIELKFLMDFECNGHFQKMYKLFVIKKNVYTYICIYFKGKIVIIA
jgi:hypothetical protein